MAAAPTPVASPPGGVTAELAAQLAAGDIAAGSEDATSLGTTLALVTAKPSAPRPSIKDVYRDATPFLERESPVAAAVALAAGASTATL